MSLLANHLIPGPPQVGYGVGALGVLMVVAAVLISRRGR